MSFQVAAIAALCVESEPDYRPLIGDVVQCLSPLVPVELGGSFKDRSVSRCSSMSRSISLSRSKSISRSRSKQQHQQGTLQKEQQEQQEQQKTDLNTMKANTWYY
jgi:hypothetical protein